MLSHASRSACRPQTSESSSVACFRCACLWTPIGSPRRARWVGRPVWALGWTARPQDQAGSWEDWFDTNSCNRSDPRCAMAVISACTVRYTGTQAVRAFATARTVRPRRSVGVYAAGADGERSGSGPGAKRPALAQRCPRRMHTRCGALSCIVRRLRAKSEQRPVSTVAALPCCESFIPHTSTPSSVAGQTPHAARPSPLPAPLPVSKPAPLAPRAPRSARVHRDRRLPRHRRRDRAGARLRGRQGGGELRQQPGQGRGGGRQDRRRRESKTRSNAVEPRLWWSNRGRRAGRRARSLRWRQRRQLRVQLSRRRPSNASCMPHLNHPPRHQHPHAPRAARPSLSRRTCRSARTWRRWSRLPLTSGAPSTCSSTTRVRLDASRGRGGAGARGQCRGRGVMRVQSKQGARPRRREAAAAGFTPQELVRACWGFARPPPAAGRLAAAARGAALTPHQSARFSPSCPKAPRATCS